MAFCENPSTVWFWACDLNYITHRSRVFYSEPGQRCSLMPMRAFRSDDHCSSLRWTFTDSAREGGTEALRFGVNEALSKIDRAWLPHQLRSIVFSSGFTWCLVCSLRRCCYVACICLMADFQTTFRGFLWLRKSAVLVVIFRTSGWCGRYFVNSLPIIAGLWFVKDKLYILLGEENEGRLKMGFYWIERPKTAACEIMKRSSFLCMRTRFNMLPLELWKVPNCGTLGLDVWGRPKLSLDLC